MGKVTIIMVFVTMVCGFAVCEPTASEGLTTFDLQVCTAGLGVEAWVGIAAGVVTFLLSLNASLVKKVIELLREVRDVLDVATKSLDDNKLTADEIKDIKKEAADVKAAYKAIFEIEPESETKEGG